MKETILSLIRHGLTFGGGILVAKQAISGETLNTVIAAVVPAIGAIWGAYDEYRAAKLAKA